MNPRSMEERRIREMMEDKKNPAGKGPAAKGPAGKAPMGQRPEIGKDTVKRLLSYVKRYKKLLVAVFFGIAVSALAGVLGSLFLGKLIDDYITPLIVAKDPDYGPLKKAIVIMACIYLTGALGAYMYNRLMVVVAQGVLKTIRDEMFAHMQKLPIRFFDTHTHGDIMSYYTNDIDALRQAIAQSIPQMINSLFTIVAVLLSMIYISIWLSLFVLVIVFVMLRLSRMSTVISKK